MFTISWSSRQETRNVYCARDFSPSPTINSGTARNKLLIVWFYFILFHRITSRYVIIVKLYLYV